ncbi:hypothetical protein AAHA92_24405 [Salvia divinorum]|uniref:Transposase n=1 Tax=Salvia divinorum TaxID=28513 RepID=A0ABD1G796_SALDI
MKQCLDKLQIRHRHPSNLRLRRLGSVPLSIIFLLHNPLATSIVNVVAREFRRHKSSRLPGAWTDCKERGRRLKMCWFSSKKWCDDPRWKWFKGCLGALDGTYINVRDSRVLRDAVTREVDRLRVPIGSYYLCDNGYANSEGFLTPFKGVRSRRRESANSAKYLSELEAHNAVLAC